MNYFDAKEAKRISEKSKNTLDKILNNIKSEAEKGFGMYCEMNEFSKEIEIELIERGFKVVSQRPDGKHVGGWYRAIYWG